MSTARSNQFYIVQDTYPKVILNRAMRMRIADLRKAGLSANDIAGEAKAAGEPGIVIGAVAAYAAKVNPANGVNKYW